MEKIKEVFGKYKQVKAAYLFGSAASGKTGKLSDIDIAVLLSTVPNVKSLLNLKLNLITELTEVFKSNKIDFVLFNKKKSIFYIK